MYREYKPSCIERLYGKHGKKLKLCSKSVTINAKKFFILDEKNKNCTSDCSDKCSAINYYQIEPSKRYRKRRLIDRNPSCDCCSFDDNLNIDSCYEDNFCCCKDCSCNYIDQLNNYDSAFRNVPYESFQSNRILQESAFCNCPRDSEYSVCECCNDDRDEYYFKHSKKRKLDLNSSNVTIEVNCSPSQLHPAVDHGKEVFMNERIQSCKENAVNKKPSSESLIHTSCLQKLCYAACLKVFAKPIETRESQTKLNSRQFENKCNCSEIVKKEICDFYSNKNDDTRVPCDSTMSCSLEQYKSAVKSKNESQTIDGKCTCSPFQYIDKKNGKAIYPETFKSNNPFLNGRSSVSEAKNQTNPFITSEKENPQDNTNPAQVIHKCCTCKENEKISVEKPMVVYIPLPSNPFPTGCHCIKDSATDSNRPTTSSSMATHGPDDTPTVSTPAYRLPDINIPKKAESSQPRSTSRPDDKKPINVIKKSSARH